MRGTRRRVARLREAKPAEEQLRHEAEIRAESGAGQRAESPMSAAGILRLQRTIGNQAVQRLIQRAPAEEMDSAKQEEKELPPVLASITLENAGKLEGGSKVAGHEGDIEIQSISLGASSGASIGSSGEGRGEEKSEKFLDLSVLKYQDDASTALFMAVAKGDPVKAARFDFVRRGDSGAVETKRSLKFGAGDISNIQVGGAGPDGRPMESLTMRLKFEG
jgi:type VI protein secretion system component Hcp